MFVGLRPIDKETAFDIKCRFSWANNFFQGSCTSKFWVDPTATLSDESEDESDIETDTAASIDPLAEYPHWLLCRNAYHRPRRPVTVLPVDSTDGTKVFYPCISGRLVLTRGLEFVKQQLADLVGYNGNRGFVLVRTY